MGQMFPTESLTYLKITKEIDLLFANYLHLEFKQDVNNPEFYYHQKDYSNNF